MPVDLREALNHHRRGNLERASRIYEAALAQSQTTPMRSISWAWSRCSKATCGKRCH